MRLNRTGSVEALFFESFLFCRGSRESTVPLLELGRWDVAQRPSGRALLNRSTHSSVANSTSSRPFQGSSCLGLVEADDAFGHGVAIGVAREPTEASMPASSRRLV